MAEIDIRGLIFVLSMIALFVLSGLRFTQIEGLSDAIRLVLAIYVISTSLSGLYNASTRLIRKYSTKLTLYFLAHLVFLLFARGT